MSVRTEWLVCGLVWVGFTVLLAPLCFFAVMALAGPHGGILPEFLHRPVLLAAWVLLIGLPAWIALAVRQRMHRKSAMSAPAQ